MKEQLEQIRCKVMQDLDNADLPAALEELLVRLLGKKGELSVTGRPFAPLHPLACVRGSFAELCDPAAPVCGSYV